jgi:DNA-directed RNA polymerase specialized sigma24 family protein
MNSALSLLTALKNGEEKALQYIYWDYFASTQKYIVMNSGSAEDAEDVFQEAVLIFLHKIRQPEFALTCSVKTYLYAICKRLWLSELSRRKGQPISADNLEISDADFLSSDDEAKQQEDQWNSLQVVMKQITQYCSKLLTEFFIDGKISADFKNNHTRDNLKYKCLRQAQKAAQKIKFTYG